MAVSITQPFTFQLGQARVYTSPVLTTGANWIVRPWLNCERLDERAGPAIDEAVLTYDIGEFTVREQPPFTVDENGDPIEAQSVVTQLDLNLHYCKIEVLDGAGTVVKTWYGVIEISEDETALPSDDAQFVSAELGRQTMRAFGLLRLLEQTQIETSQVVDVDGNAFTIGRGLEFNGDRHGPYPVRGNSTATRVPAGVFVFSFEPRDQALWDGTTALQYLIQYHSPTNGAGATAGTWLFANSNPSIVDWYDITVETDRRTVKDVIDAIVDRRRLLGYRVYGEEVAGNLLVSVEAFTFASSNISLPGRGKTIAANTDQIELEFQKSTLVSSSKIIRTEVHAADRIVVYGEFITSLVTLDYGDLTDGWTSAQQTEYLAGDSGGDDEVANTAARARDAMADVFSRFVIADDWDQEVEERGAGAFYFVTIPYEHIPASFTDANVVGLFSTNSATPGPWWFRGKIFSRRLTLTDDESGEFRTPFVLFKEPDSVPAVYRFAEHLSVGAEDDGEPRNFACTSSVLDDILGVRIRVNQAGAQQLIADGKWSGAAATKDEHDPDEAAVNAVDFEDMLLTASVEWDERVRFTHQVRTPAAGAHERVRRIRLPDARLDFELPGCVTDVAADGTLIESTGRVLRNDLQRLEEIALAAAEWYGTERAAISVSYEDITPFVEIGQLVTTAEGTTVNTVITSVSYDFARGQAQLATSYVEADFS